MPDPKPHTDERGHVLIPHPEGSGGLKCEILCLPLTDGVRHLPTCPKVLAWREALATLES